MKNMKNYICGFLTIIFCTIGVEISTGQLVSFDCHPIPDNPAMFTGFKIRASGEFGSTGYGYWNTTPSYTLINNRITIMLECYRNPEYLYFPVYTPWQLDIQIAVPYGLYPGGYLADVILTNLNYGTSETSTTAFVVGHLPEFSSVSPTNSDIALRWWSDPTLLYSVQYSTQLTANSWEYIPSISNVAGSNYSAMEYQVPMTNDPLRMYRLVSTPK
jgi:hypothetical protein